MKKILSLGAAAAVLSLTAVAASAQIIATNNDTAPVAGSEYVVEVVVDGEFPLTNDLAATQFTISASDNLTLVSGTPIGGGLFNAERMTFAYAAAEAPADGTVLLSLVFTVDAAAEEEVSVAIVPDAGFEAGIDVDAVTAVVIDVVETVVSDETEPVETEPVETEPVETEPVETEPVESEPAVTPVETETSGNGENNVNTGVALAVVPALVAGAAVVVAAKKRK